MENKNLNTQDTANSDLGAVSGSFSLKFWEEALKKKKKKCEAREIK